MSEDLVKGCQICFDTGLVGNCCGDEAECECQIQLIQKPK